MLTGGSLMRIIAGAAKGMRLKRLSRLDVRPTGDRVKEALFNILRPHLYGALFLDLFAGFGGVGIEALSQGAKGAFFLEKNPKVLEVLAENLKKTSLDHKARLLQVSLPQGLKRVKGNSFDLIFLDPPYNKGLVLPVLKEILSLHLLSLKGLLIVEHDSSLQLEEEIPLTLVDQRSYGSEGLSFFTRGDT